MYSGLSQYVDFCPFCKWYSTLFTPLTQLGIFVCDTISINMRYELIFRGSLDLEVVCIAR